MDSQSSNQKKSHTFKDLMIVGSVLAIIFIANIIILDRQRDVQTNYWQIPDENSPFYQLRVMIIALERNFTSDGYSVEIRDAYNSTLNLDVPQFWKIENGKYLHIVNFTGWTEWKPNTNYRLFFTFRSWWSPIFQVNETGFYFIAG